MERKAIDRIQRLRAAHLNGTVHSAMEERAETMHDILNGYHGNAKLRLEVLSSALGSTMKTLEREFAAQYAETMKGFHERKRLEYAEQQIIFDPGVKLGAIAHELGYNRQSELNRFFRRKRGLSLTKFAEKVRERQEKGDFGNDHLLGEGN